MLCKRTVFAIGARQFLIKTTRLVTTESAKNAETAEINSRLDYYKHINETQNVNAKPHGWDDALPFDQIPGPKPLPLIGNIWRFLLPSGEFYGLDLLEIHRKLVGDHGKITILGGLPARAPVVFISDPADIEMQTKRPNRTMAVTAELPPLPQSNLKPTLAKVRRLGCISSHTLKLMRNEGPWPIRQGMPSFQYYRNVHRKEVFKGCSGVVTLQGEDWFKFRSAVNPILMQPRNALQYVQNMDLVANELVDNIKYFSTLNEEREMPEDFLNELHKWALESMGVVTMDKHLGCLKRDLKKDSEPEKLIRSVLEMFDLMYKLDVLPSWWRNISTPSWRKFVKRLDFLTFTNMKYINEVSKEFESKTEVPYHEMSVLQKLLKLDKKVAVAMALDMMIAGVDTTGRTLAAALYYLARHPEKQEKFRKEVLKSLPTIDTPVTKEMVMDAPYLKAIVKETTRLSPIAVGNLRTTVKDLVLAGYQIPKGTEVLTTNLLIATDDQYFHEGEKFIPERWLRSTTGELSYKNSNQFVNLPFGFGPRSCIGKRLANMELEVALMKVIRNFKLEWTHEDMVFKTTFLHGIARPLKIRVTPVDS